MEDCNTLQHTVTHCDTLQRTATHCNTLQHTATNAMEDAKMPKVMLQRVAVCCSVAVTLSWKTQRCQRTWNMPCEIWHKRRTQFNASSVLVVFGPKIQCVLCLSLCLVSFILCVLHLSFWDVTQACIDRPCSPCSLLFRTPVVCRVRSAKASCVFHVLVSLCNLILESSLLHE